MWATPKPHTQALTLAPSEAPACRLSEGALIAAARPTRQPAGARSGFPSLLRCSLRSVCLLAPSSLARRGGSPLRFTAPASRRCGCSRSASLRFAPLLPAGSIPLAPRPLVGAAGSQPRAPEPACWGFRGRGATRSLRSRAGLGVGLFAGIRFIYNLRL